MHYGFRTGGSPQARIVAPGGLRATGSDALSQTPTKSYEPSGGKKAWTAEHEIWRATRAERIVEALPVGDVLVEFPAGHGFLVERKTAADLASSICDGRSSSVKSVVAIM